MDRLWVYMLCYNEEQLLPFTLEYYSQYADRIFVYDNMSTDSSVTICKSFNKVTVECFNTGGLVKDHVFRKIKNNAWKKARGKVKYVAVIDTDEIIFYKKGLDVLLDEAYLSNATFIKQPYAYTVYSANIVNPAKDFTLSPHNTALVCGSSGGKISLFSPNLKEINYKAGAHRLRPKGKNLTDYYGGIWFHFSHIFGAKMIAQRYADRISRLSAENKRCQWGTHYSLKYDDIIEQMQFGQLKLVDILSA